tara:strand:+ start:200 stop:427 length:228 start_codon:yes stop_codon:yes gene_type:complete
METSFWVFTKMVDPMGKLKYSINRPSLRMVKKVNMRWQPTKAKYPVANERAKVKWSGLTAVTFKVDGTTMKDLKD